MSQLPLPSPPPHRLGNPFVLPSPGFTGNRWVYRSSHIRTIQTQFATSFNFKRPAYHHRGSVTHDTNCVISSTAAAYLRTLKAKGATTRLSSPRPLVPLYSMAQLVVPISILVVAVGLVIHILTRRSPKHYNFPPGPKPLPLIGNIHQVPKTHPWLKYTEWAKQYGMTLPEPPQSSCLSVPYRRYCLLQSSRQKYLRLEFS